MIKKFITATIVVLMVILFVAPKLRAFVYANKSCLAYGNCEPEGGPLSAASPQPLFHALIVEGGACFLKSNSQMLMLLNKVELSGIGLPGYSAMADAVNGALEHMEKASAAYKKLIDAAEATPYNPDIIAKLTAFDYQAFEESHNLNTTIFSRLESLLTLGDVTGVYKLLKGDMDSIVIQLQRIKTDIDAKTLPDLELLYGLNQLFSDSLLTGQYMAQVFKNL